MQRIKAIKRFGAVIVMACLMMVSVLAGCQSSKEDPEKVRNLDFTVVGQNEIPQELMEIIGQKKTAPFRLTFSSGEDLYIVAGYGEQKTGGYSISVSELYLTENSIVIRTELKGPEKGEQAGPAVSYPYIVIKTAFMDEPVVFK